MAKLYVAGGEIEYVESVRDLGYFINRTLTHDDHINNIIRKGYGALSELRTLKHTLPTNIKLQLYKTMILPIIDYMDIIYHGYGIHGTSSNSDRLEKLQKNCIRFIVNLRRHDHISAHRDSLNLMNLFARRSLHVACMINKK